MNTVLLASIAGIVAAVCWGTTDWLASKMTKKYKKLEVNFAFQLPSILIMLPVLAIIGKPIPDVTLMFRLGLISFFYTGAFLCLLKALSVGSVGIVVPLSNTYSLLTLFLSSIFIGVAFNSLQIVAIIGIVVGAVLLAYEKNHNKIPIRKLHKATFFALLAAIFWGFGFFFVDTVIGSVSWQMLTGVTSAFMVLFAFLLVVITSKSNTSAAVKSSLKIKIALVSGVIAQIGAIALYFGSERSGSVVIPVVIASSSPLVASGLSAYFDKEKLSLVKRFGAVLVIAGIIVLNLV